ncbi:histidine ammonia-lyase [Taibaiella sp. KBW10]|uniref:HAL/PAL/TAL family ammonia-lyase n=1 Tax=Taibaiella sp. KBW10 TaxID=2153357 RepID=UPI000F599207|nr:aromatic amino acid ammonia-lyase [Taibaiella sp. KBW10]RQO31861.1 histidine ammonia-lyase [Taibaiella sp. KBW10]
METIGHKILKLEALEQIVLQKDHIELDATAVAEVEASHAFLTDFSKDKLIYGINTGFGPMAQYRIEDEDCRQLQLNLIRSHSSGMGLLLTPDQSRALMLARLNTVMRAYSGVNPELVVLMKELINNEAYPCVYQHGGVGASGDLVQLAHLALGLIGEGYFQFKGAVVKAATVFAELNLQPLAIHIREGLSLLNGTSAMTGIGAINVLHARKLLAGEMLFSLMVNEIMEAYDDHFSEELNGVKLHKGQQTVAAAMRAITKNSGLMRKRHEHLYDKKVTESVIEDKVQEYYSLRCVPQILGPIYDTIEYTAQIIEQELNSVNDNPVVDYRTKNIYHGGNFHGDYVALEMDKLKIAITKLSMLAERQLNFLLNPALNKRLTPFINQGVLGLNFGIQGMQYPAVSNVAENQMLSNPMYVHSIPNNNDNQDIVSMGTNAALICAKVIENSFETLAVHACTIVQAVDAKGFKDRLSPATRWMYDELSVLAPPFKEDVPAFENLAKVKEWLMKTEVGAKMKKLLGW